MQSFAVLCVAACFILQAACTAQFPSLRRHAHSHHASAQPAPEASMDTSVPSTPVEVPEALSGTLPSVSEVFGGASQSLKSINSEVSSLEALAPSRMSNEKAKFERKLKLQEDANRAVVQANAAIQSNISTLMAANEELRKKAKSFEDKNALMRKELSATGSRLGEVNEYISSALHSSDDSQAPALVVLGGAHGIAQKTFHKKHQPRVFTEVDDSVDEVAAEPQQPPADVQSNDDEDDEQDQGLAFVALSSRRSMARSTPATDSEEPSAVVEANNTDSTPAAAPTAEADPQKVLAALARRVSELTKQETAEEAKYTALYKKDAKAGEKRHKALLLQQRQLITKREALSATHSKLNDACAHLEKTQIDLASRLRGLGLFAQRISHLLMAPDGEAAGLLSALPKKVSPAKGVYAAP